MIEVYGIIIKETPYGETSKIINLYTKEYGIIGIMCKGCMGIKSKLRASTLKLTYGVFSIYYKKDKLSILKDVSVIDAFIKIKSDILLISYATYLSDLVNQVVKQSNSDKIYDDFINSLFKINEGIDPLVITNIMEVKMLSFLGVELNLSSCISCGNKKDIITISESRGGLVCKNCYSDERIVPISIVKTLNMYYLVDIKSINSVKLDKNIVFEINRFLESYYDDYTGLYLKSKDFLKKLRS